MTPDGPNPTLMQSKITPHGSKGRQLKSHSSPSLSRSSAGSPQSGQEPLPLLLIHDGGGTTAGFWALGDLHREVWVLHNPRFWSGAPWNGRVEEMVTCYVDLLRKSNLRGRRILIGGWSLGGFIALEIAKVFALEQQRLGGGIGKNGIEVAGLLLVDSPFIPGPNFRQSVTTSAPRLPDFPPKVKQMLAYCDTLLDSYTHPRWDSHANDGDDVTFEINRRSYCVGPGTVLRKPLNADWTAVRTNPQPSSGYFSSSTQSSSSDDSNRSVLAPPSGVLLRCVKHTESLDGGSDPCLADVQRDDPLLGWETAYPSFIKAVVDVESNHYTAFNRYDTKQVRFNLPSLYSTVCLV